MYQILILQHQKFAGCILHICDISSLTEINLHSVQPPQFLPETNYGDFVS